MRTSLSNNAYVLREMRVPNSRQLKFCRFRGTGVTFADAFARINKKKKKFYFRNQKAIIRRWTGRGFAYNSDENEFVAPLIRFFYPREYGWHLVPVYLLGRTTIFFRLLHVVTYFFSVIIFIRHYHYILLHSDRVNTLHYARVFEFGLFSGHGIFVILKYCIFYRNFNKKNKINNKSFTPSFS